MVALVQGTVWNKHSSCFYYERSHLRTKLHKLEIRAQGHPERQGLVKNENIDGACGQSYLCTVHLHTSKPVKFPFLFKPFRLNVLSFTTEISPPGWLL